MAFRPTVLLAAVWLALGLALAPAVAQNGAAPSAPAPSASAPAVVVDGEPAPAAAIDTARTQLDQIIATLRRQSLDDDDLQGLRAQVDPIEASMQALIARIAPRLDAIKARIDQLGPKPDDKAAPETASVTADREAQQKLFDATNELLKRARLIAVQAEQVRDGLVARRRAGFLRNLFEQSRSVASPALWADVVDDVPKEMRAVAQVGGDFLSRAASTLTGWKAVSFFGLLALLAGALVPANLMARRILAREPTVEDPGPMRRVLGACWSALVVATLPVAAVTLLILLLNAFDLVSERLMPLERALAEMVTRVAIMAALARAILAPDRPNWRLVAVPEAAVDRFLRLAVGLAALVSAMHVIEVVHDIIVSSVATTVLARGLGALVVSLLIAGALYGLPGEAQADEDECLGPRVERRRDWFGVIRLTGWVLALVMFAAVLAGYVALGAFLADQLVWLTMVGLGAFLLHRLAVDLVEGEFKPGTVVGRALVTTVGLRRERLGQIGILLAGLLRLVIIVVAALLVAAPWGIQSDDLSGTLRAAYFGFTIGGVTLSPSNLVTALIVFALAFAATRAFQSWLGERFLPTTTLDSGLRNSIRTSVGYLGVLLALSLSLGHLGLSFDKLAIVAGALSVGIGFGLQSIVSNFVSGLILLWERAIRVGDWVVVGTDQGYVRRINVRSTEIETFDRAMMIVPNSNLVTGVVKNWVRSDRIGRVTLPLTVQHGSDPERVRAVLIEIAKSIDLIARLPTPQVMFKEISAGGLSFDLICFVNDVETSLRTKSELHYAIFRRFGEEGIAIAPGAPAPTVIALAPDTQQTLFDSLRRAAE